MNDEASGFTDGEWNGRILQLRFDPVNEVTDTLTSEMTLYAIGFFKNLEDAQKFNVEGLTVETDPGAAIDPVESSEGTEAPAEDTAAETDAETAVAEDSDTAEATTPTTTDDNTDDKGGNTGIIIAIVAVVVVAVAAVAGIVIKKKKA